VVFYFQQFYRKTGGLDFGLLAVFGELVEYA
jgi:hypothetical protein